VPQTYQFIRLRIRKRFQQHTPLHAEDSSIRARANSQRDESDAREHARTPKSALNLSQLAFEGFHSDAPECLGSESASRIRWSRDTQPIEPEFRGIEDNLHS
jgi:hypothetical protein